MVLGISAHVGSSWPSLHLTLALPNPVMRPLCVLLSLWALPCVRHGKEEGHTDGVQKTSCCV